MIRPHRLDPADLTALADGPVGAGLVDGLRRIQVSRNLLLMRNLLDHWVGQRADRDECVRVLDAADRHCPAAVKRLVGAPMVGAWAVGSTRVMRHGTTTAQHHAHLLAIAAVAAAEARLDVSLRIPLHDGCLALPTYGVARFALPARHAQVAVADGKITIRAGSEVLRVPARRGDEGPGWSGVRDIYAEDAVGPMCLAIDDVDPYRHGHHAPPSERLSAAEVSLWQDQLRAGWALLSRWLPAYADELRAGLSTLVPLVRTDQTVARSATLRSIFGAFGLTQPTSGVEFAVTLVHEFQHSKLSAALCAERLYDTTDGRLYFAPWRSDPRPLSGLLQGIYAFVAIAEVWRALREAPGMAQAAEARYAKARLHVDQGLTALEGSPAVTASGALVALGLRRRVDAMLADAISPVVDRQARREFAALRRAWVERNVGVAERVQG